MPEKDTVESPFVSELPESWSVSDFSIFSHLLKLHETFSLRSDHAIHITTSTRIVKASKVDFNNILLMVNHQIAHHGNVTTIIVLSLKRRKI